METQERNKENICLVEFTPRLWEITEFGECSKNKTGGK